MSIQRRPRTALFGAIRLIEADKASKQVIKRATSYAEQMEKYTFPSGAQSKAFLKMY